MGTGGHSSLSGAGVDRVDGRVTFSAVVADFVVSKMAVVQGKHCGQVFSVIFGEVTGTGVVQIGQTFSVVGFGRAHLFCGGQGTQIGQGVGSIVVGLILGAAVLGQGFFGGRVHWTAGGQI